MLIFSVLFTGCVFAASEIHAFAPGVTTAYAVIRNGSGSVWYITGQAFEAWGTGGRDADDYDIALTDKSGGMFVGDFDTNVSAGSYYIASHYQSGGSPDDADPIVWIEQGYWDGDEWFGQAGIQDVNNIAGDLPTKEEIRAEIDANSTQLALIVADTNELQTDWTNGGRLDLILDQIKDLLLLVDTTVKDGNDANNFTITAAVDSNDVYWGHLITVTDADDSHTEVRSISNYEYGTDIEVTVDIPFSFTPAAGDVVHIMGTDYTGLQYWLSYQIDNAERPVYSFTGPGYPSGDSGGTAGSVSIYQGNGADP
jgi:hypothetical protein